jgi:hypothetical protein
MILIFIVEVPGSNFDINNDDLDWDFKWFSCRPVFLKKGCADR